MVKCSIGSFYAVIENYPFVFQDRQLFLKEKLTFLLNLVCFNVLVSLLIFHIKT